MNRQQDLVTTGSACRLRAGAAKTDITNREGCLVNDPLYVKALVLESDDTTAVIITIDAVATEEIGTVPGTYLAQVREQVQQDLKINPAHILINASHCHGHVCDDLTERTVRTVQDAYKQLVPVNLSICRGFESRIMENRRLLLKNQLQADVRRAYSLPADQEIAAVGPTDPEIGILRLDRAGGQPVAVLFHFACHPIQGVPNGGNTADLAGFACSLIEDQLGEPAIAFFLQGCAGDINPILYKDVNHPHDAEPLGTMLGLSVLNALKKAQPCEPVTLAVINRHLQLPRADLTSAIAAAQAKQDQLLSRLQGTSLNLKTFLQLAVKYSLSPEYPSYDASQYLRDNQLGRDNWRRLDENNKGDIEAYIGNIRIMEQLTRVQTNLALLNLHDQRNQAAGSGLIDAELVGLRIGDFHLVTFPGELSVQIGLNIKMKSAQPFTYVSGYTNGYIYYAPTAAQLENRGEAQEDSDCELAAEWQQIFEGEALDLLRRLADHPPR